MDVSFINNINSIISKWKFVPVFCDLQILCIDISSRSIDKVTILPKQNESVSRVHIASEVLFAHYTPQAARLGYARLYNLHSVVYKKKVNKLMKIQNEPRSQLPTGIIGKQVCLFRIFHLNISNMNIYCCCLQKYANKSMKIQNELRGRLPKGIIGKQVC